MQFSLRTLMACAVLVALTASGIALNYKYENERLRAMRLEEETAMLLRATGPADAGYENYERFFASFEKQKDELALAETNYQVLAETLSQLQVSPDKFSIIKLPDTSWDDSELEVDGWRIHVPSQISGQKLTLALDFLPEEADSTMQSSDDSKRLVQNSVYFRPELPLRHDLPEGESTIQFESRLSNKACTIQVLLNGEGIGSFDLIKACDGSLRSESIPGVGIGQRDLDIRSPLSLIRWTPMLVSADSRETVWLRILPVASTEVQK